MASKSKKRNQATGESAELRHPIEVTAEATQANPTSWRKIGGTSLLAACIILFFFFPNYSRWGELWSPRPTSSPTIHRARAVLQQLRQPFIKIEDPTNRVLNWRLVLPLLGHWLHLPDKLFLALPHLGCFAVLLLFSWQLFKVEQDWKQVLLGCVVFGAQPWFFVSTGWLAYFDSWIVLASLCVALSSRSWLVIPICLVTPWIDERFVFGLPAALAVHCALAWRASDDAVKSMKRQLLIVSLCALPYVLLRLFFVLNRDPTSSSYINEHWIDVQKVPWTQFLWGLWQGFRAGWWLIMIPAYFVAKQKKVWGWFIGCTFLVTSLMSLVIAGDMTRSLMMLAPALAGGIMMTLERAPMPIRRALLVTAVATLMLPAEHVIWTFQVPIRYVYAEMDHAQEFQNKLLGKNNSAKATPMSEIREMLLRGRHADALKRLESLPPDSVAFNEMSLLKVIALISERRQAEAEAVGKELTIKDGSSPEALLAESLILMSQSSYAQAKEKVQAAKAAAPADWTFDADLKLLEEHLKKVSARLPMLKVAE